MRLAALQGVVNDRLAEPLGSPRPLRPRRFRRDLRFPPVVVPRSLAQTGSSPRELHSSSESSASHPPSPFPAPAPSLGLRALFATSPAGVRAAGNPTSHRVSVLGVSHAHDGLLRQSARGFVSPHSHVQGSPSGIFLAHSRFASSAFRALSSFGGAALLRLPEAPHVVAPPSGLSIRARVRGRVAGV